MDFNDTAQEADFREEVKTWLKDNVPSEAELTGLGWRPLRRITMRQKKIFKLMAAWGSPGSLTVNSRTDAQSFWP